MSGIATPLKPLTLAVAMASQQLYACDSPITVDSLTDEGGTSFHEAMQTAAACSADSQVEVVVSDTLAGETITLDSANLPYYLQSGQLITISGPSSADVTITDSAGTSSIFVVQESAQAPIENLTLYGGGSGVARSENPIRVSSSILTLNKVTASDFSVVGSTLGGVVAARYSSTVTVNDSTFARNQAEVIGAAIYSSASDIEINRSRFEQNQADSGGAIYIFEGDLDITDSVFDANTTINQNGATGGAIFQTNEVGGNDLNVSGSTFSNNTSYTGGGAIHRQYGSGAFVIHDSQFTQNTSKNWTGGSGDAKGGAIYVQPTQESRITHSTFENNRSDHLGGAIYARHYVTGATLEISDSVFDGNQSLVETVEASTSLGHGANIYMESFDESGPLTVDVKRSEFIDGVAHGSGGAFYLGTADIGINVALEDVIIQGQQISGSGAAAYITGDNKLVANRSLVASNTGNTVFSLVGNASSAAPILQMTNVTVASNQVSQSVVQYSGDHGLNNFIKHSTFANNTSESANGGSVLYGSGVSADDAVVISHSIISNNTGGTAALCQLNEATYAFAMDYTLLDNGDGMGGSCLALTNNGGNQIGTGAQKIDPLLGELQDNGGATKTLLPAANSPALNAGDANISDAPEVDQRGSARIMRGQIDLGAVEVGNGLPVFSNLNDYTINVHQTVAWDIDLASDVNGDSIEYSVSGLPNGVTFNENLLSIGGNISADAYRTQTSYEVSISAADGYGTTTETRTLTFTNNVPELPVFENVSVVVGSLVSIDFETATDADTGATLEYTVSGLPEGIVENEGRLEGSATQDMIDDGPYTITVAVSDGYDTVTESFTLTVTAQVTEPVEEHDSNDDSNSDGNSGFGGMHYAWLMLLSVLGLRRRS